MAAKDWSVYCRSCGQLRHTWSLFAHRPYEEEVMRRMMCFECNSDDIIVTDLKDGVILRDGDDVLGVLAMRLKCPKLCYLEPGKKNTGKRWTFCHQCGSKLVAWEPLPPEKSVK